MIGPVAIRPATPSEHRTLEALQLRASLANLHDRTSLLANPDAIQLPLDQIAAGRVLVAERDGAIIGFAVALTRADGDAELDGLFVDPANWRGGIGRQLVAAAAGLARAEGAKVIHVIGNPHAVAFYEACGFSRLGHCETRFGPAVNLSRPLNSGH